MTTLEKALKRRTDLGHLSVIPLSDGRWQAGFKRNGKKDYVVGIHEDIVEAMKMALGPRKGQTDEQLEDDIETWNQTLMAAEKKRKQPYPHETTEDLVARLKGVHRDNSDII